MWPKWVEEDIPCLERLCSVFTMRESLNVFISTFFYFDLVLQELDSHFTASLSPTSRDPLPLSARLCPELADYHHKIIITIIIIIIITRPKPAYGRQGLAGSWGQDTDKVSNFWVFLTFHFAQLEIKPTWDHSWRYKSTWHHENQTWSHNKNMKNQPGTMKNQPGTMKNH